MRLQLAFAAITATAITTAGTHAVADGSIGMRGVYYKERATRVMQPMLDGMFEVGLHGTVEAHVLVDAITSASTSSGASDTAFSERRYEGGAGYNHDFGTVRVGAAAKYSDEPDYKSTYGNVHAEMDLAQKNTVIAASLGRSSDEINAGQAQGLFNPMIACKASDPLTFSKTCDLATTSFGASISQVLSRNAVAGLTYDVAYADGYQANPYRQVLAGLALAPERHPNTRLRQAFGVSARYYLRDSKTTFIGAYRYYRDDWKVRAQTPELRIVQEVGRVADAAIRYRYYRQTQAFFFQPRYDSSDVATDPYLTDDTKLSKFDGHTIEAKFGVIGEAFGLEDHWSEARLEGIIEYVVQNNRFGNVIIGHVALTIPFEY